MDVVADRFELFLGIAAVEGSVDGLLFIDGVFRHDRQRCVTLRPEHPSTVVARAETMTRLLKVWALALEGLQRGSLTHRMTGCASVAGESGDLFLSLIHI